MATQIIFSESSYGYKGRTVENAQAADLTLAFAVDFTTAGERVTANAAGKRILQISLDAQSVTYPEGLVPYLREYIDGMKADGTITPSPEGLKLNIAGNGISHFQKMGISQEVLDGYITSVLKGLKEEGVAITSVRSGGQSGADEAGLKAAVAADIPEVICHAPKGWLFRDETGRDFTDEAMFKRRFDDGLEQQEEIEPQLEPIMAEPKIEATTLSPETPVASPVQQNAYYNVSAHADGEHGNAMFSGTNAIFLAGTKLGEHEIGGMSIDDVYNSIVRKAKKGYEAKAGTIAYAANSASMTEEQKQEYSYHNALLPLWSMWAVQNKSKIEWLRMASAGRSLVNPSAPGLDNNARALTDILNGHLSYFTKEEVEKYFSPTRSISSKVNADILEGFDIYTLGLGTMDAETMYSSIPADVDTVVDIRGYTANPSYPHMNKSSLSSLLPQRGVKYTHLKGLSCKASSSMPGSESYNQQRDEVIDLIRSGRKVLVITGKSNINGSARTVLGQEIEHETAFRVAHLFNKKGGISLLPQSEALSATIGQHIIYGGTHRNVILRFQENGFKYVGKKREINYDISYHTDKGVSLEKVKHADDPDQRIISGRWNYGTPITFNEPVFQPDGTSDLFVAPFVKNASEADVTILFASSLSDPSIKNKQAELNGSTYQRNKSWFLKGGTIVSLPTKKEDFYDIGRIERTAEKLSERIAYPLAIKYARNPMMDLNAISLNIDGSHIAQISNDLTELPYNEELDYQGYGTDYSLITQEDVNYFIGAVLERMMSLDLSFGEDAEAYTIGKVVSTFQTGVAEAAILASQRLGLETEVTPATDWAMTIDNETLMGQTVKDKAMFLNRAHLGLMNRRSLEEFKSETASRMVARDVPTEEFGLSDRQILMLSLHGFRNEDIVAMAEYAAEQKILIPDNKSLAAFTDTCAGLGINTSGVTTEQDLNLRSIQVGGLEKEWSDGGVSYITINSPEYPEQLRAMEPIEVTEYETEETVGEDNERNINLVPRTRWETKPAVLWYTGDISLLNTPSYSLSTSVVSGAENINKAKRLAEGMAENDITLFISEDPSMPNNMDAVAAAQEKGGKVVLFSADGVDINEPRSVEEINKEIETLESAIEEGTTVDSEETYTKIGKLLKEKEQLTTEENTGSKEYIKERNSQAHHEENVRNVRNNKGLVVSDTQPGSHRRANGGHKHLRRIALLSTKTHAVLSSAIEPVTDLEPLKLLSAVNDISFVAVAIPLIGGLATARVLDHFKDRKENQAEKTSELPEGVSKGDTDEATIAKLTESAEEGFNSDEAPDLRLGANNDVLLPSEMGIDAIEMDGHKVFFVSDYYPEIHDALRQTYGENIEIAEPSEKNAILREMKNGVINIDGFSVSVNDGLGDVGLLPPEPNLEHYIWYDGNVYDIVSAPAGAMGLAPNSVRREQLEIFEDIKGACEKLQNDMQINAGYNGKGKIYTAQSDYLVIKENEIDIRRGDNVRARIWINERGELKVQNFETKSSLFADNNDHYEHIPNIFSSDVVSKRTFTALNAKDIINEVKAALLDFNVEESLNTALLNREEREAHRQNVESGFENEIRKANIDVFVQEVSTAMSEGIIPETEKLLNISGDISMSAQMLAATTEKVNEINKKLYTCDKKLKKMDEQARALNEQSQREGISSEGKAQIQELQIRINAQNALKKDLLIEKHFALRSCRRLVSGKEIYYDNKKNQIVIDGHRLKIPAGKVNEDMKAIATSQINRFRTGQEIKNLEKQVKVMDARLYSIGQKIAVNEKRGLFDKVFDVTEENKTLESSAAEITQRKVEIEKKIVEKKEYLSTLLTDIKNMNGGLEEQKQAAENNVKIVNNAGMETTSYGSRVSFEKNTTTNNLKSHKIISEYKNEIAIAQGEKGQAYINQKGEIISKYYPKLVEMGIKGYGVAEYPDRRINIIRKDGSEVFDVPVKLGRLSANEKDAPLKYKRGQEYGLVDASTGEKLSDKTYKFISPFTEGFSMVQASNREKDITIQGKWNFVNKKGELILSQWMDRVEKFTEGIATIDKDGMRYKIDTTGAIQSQEKISEAQKLSKN